MTSKNYLVFSIVFLLAAALTNAVSINVVSKESVIENEMSTAYFWIDSTAPINGTVFLSYSNIESTVTFVNVLDSGFISNIYNYSWPIKGMAPGLYSVHANLINSSGQSIAVVNKTGYVNSSLPKVISTSPSGIFNLESVTIVAITDERANCRYHSSDEHYDNMSVNFTSTGDYNHNQTLTVSQGQHIYYVRCKDVNGYKMNESSLIKFTIDVAPTAEIKLSDKSPVKAGTIEVYVKTSEKLDTAPTLEYSFNNNPNTMHIISLEGYGSEWNGYMIITDFDDNQVGTFHFKGIDKVNNIGTKITAGNLFVVDTSKPNSPISLKAESRNDGSIKLSWYYDGEEVNYFNVYRATSPDVKFVDFLSQSNKSTQFIDRSAKDKVTYYYKVSTVDNAENEGSLSAEVYTTSVDSSSIIDPATPSKTSVAVDDEPKVLPPNLVPKVTVALKDIDKSLIDISQKIKDLSAESGEQRDLIDQFEIIGQLAGASDRLSALRKKIEGFKEAYATEPELDDKIYGATSESVKLLATTPKDITLIEQSEILQSISKEDVYLAVNELFADVGLTEDEILDYAKKNSKRQNKVQVTVFVKIVEITLMDGSKSIKSFINKKIVYDTKESLSDVIVVESIPGSLAKNSNELDFSGQKIEVLKEDGPMVKFGFLEFDSLGEEIHYTLSKNIDIEEVKSSKTVVLISLNEIVISSNKITALGILDLTGLGLSQTQSYLVWMGIITIIVLTAYYFIFVKNYGKVQNKLRGIYNRDSNNLSRPPKYDDGRAQIRPNSRFKNLRFGLNRNNSSNRTQRKVNPKRGFGSHGQSASENDLNSSSQMLVALESRLDEQFNSQMRSDEDIYSEEHSSIGFGRRDLVLIHKLIDEAHHNIDYGRHHVAVRLYPKINSIYQRLPKETQLEVYERCFELNKRLSGF